MCHTNWVSRSQSRARAAEVIGELLISAAALRSCEPTYEDSPIGTMRLAMNRWCAIRSASGYEEDA